MMDTQQLSDLQGKIVNVVIPVNGKEYKMDLKVCRVKVRSILFIEVDKENRKNIFRKAPMKSLNSFTEDSITFNDSTKLEKWESSWDSINFNTQPKYYRKSYSNHSKGWNHSL